ncbi:phage tail protein [Chromobacterium vaccinii]|uniref:phage tail protein n=1 Tax=Chromobacterium vaccinii TaxID=1108595 RepID=UPI003C79329A
MADLPIPIPPGFPGVYQLELTDRVKGGAGGMANRQAEQLAERTEFLRRKIDDIVSGALSAKIADRLVGPRNIAMTGDATWSVNFDGAGNVSAALELANSGVTPGSYGPITVDAKGRVTAGRALTAADVPAIEWGKVTTGKPTTLAGYGIGDAYTKAEADSRMQYLSRSAGQLVAMFTDSPPPGTLVCNGAAVSRASYAALFAAIGTKYGAGDGSTSFNLPNLADGFALLAANGNPVGSIVAGSVIRHSHGVNAWSDAGGNHSHGVGDPGHAHNIQVNAYTIGGGQGGGAGICRTGYGSSADISAQGRGTGIWVNDGGSHSHGIGVNVHDAGGDNNYAAGMRLLICITH